jgi:hypothetical protein
VTPYESEIERLRMEVSDAQEEDAMEMYHFQYVGYRKHKSAMRLERAQMKFRKLEEEEKEKNA